MNIKYNNSLFTTEPPEYASYEEQVEPIDLDEEESIQELYNDHLQWQIDDEMLELMEKMEYRDFWKDSEEILPRAYYTLARYGKTDLEDFLAYLVEYHKEIIPLMEKLLTKYVDKVKTEENLKVPGDVLEVLL